MHFPELVVPQNEKAQNLLWKVCRNFRQQVSLKTTHITKRRSPKREAANAAERGRKKNKTKAKGETPHQQHRKMSYPDKTVVTSNSRLEMLENQRKTTRQTLQTLHETRDLSRDTAAKLDSQGEQIRKANEKMDGINNSLYESNRLLRSIGSIFGSAYNKIVSSKPPHPTTSKAPHSESTTSTPSKVASTTPRSTTTHYQPVAGTTAVASSSITPKFGDEKMEKLWKETDEDLDSMSGVLAELREMANHMNQELDRQAHDLSELDGKVDKANASLRNQELKIKKML
jgi:hypothetical protein